MRNTLLTALIAATVGIVASVIGGLIFAYGNYLG